MEHRAPDAAAPKKTRASGTNTHIAGEMFVAAELAKRGYSVSLTMGNAKAVDLFAEKDGRAICVQVKAIANKRNVGWPLNPDLSRVLDGVIYVCVILNGLDEPPTYYVLPPAEVRKRGKSYKTRAILDIGKVRGSEFLGAWHLIDAALTKPEDAIGKPLRKRPVTAN